jgi:hypothetical protein
MLQCCTAEDKPAARPSCCSMQGVRSPGIHTGNSTVVVTAQQPIQHSRNLQEPAAGASLHYPAHHGDSRNYRSVNCSSAYTAACQLGMRTTMRGIQVHVMPLQQVLVLQLIIQPLRCGVNESALTREGLRQLVGIIPCHGFVCTADVQQTCSRHGATASSLP